MSLDNEHDQFMDSLKPASPTHDSSSDLSRAEKELNQLQQDKQNLMIQQNQQYLESLFQDHKHQPVKIRNVQITNGQSYRDQFLKYQFRNLLNGEVMTLEKYLNNVNQISKILISSGIIENLHVSNNLVNPPLFSKSQAFHLVPVFNVVPVKRFFAKTGTNIGNGEGDGYIQFQLKNLFGGGENLIFDAITGTKTKSSYLINYNQPIGNNLQYMNENLFMINTRNLDWLQSNITTRGMINKIYTQFYNSNLNHEIIMENSWKILNNQKSKSLQVLQQAGSQFKSSIAYNMNYDTRDNKHLPTIGKFLQIGIEYNNPSLLLMRFKNQYPFIKTVAQTQFVQQLPIIKSNLIITNKFGLLYPLNNDKSSSSLLDRFYIGGPNDVRSFLLNGLGPKDYNSCIGGDLFFNGGISLITDIPKYNESNFKIHNFINFGRLVGFNKEISLFNNLQKLTNQYSISYGFGILFNHPMARFELNFVLPLVTHERDSLRKGIQYGIGVSFL
ncbi:sorting and assembly machinery (SAM) complex subunit of the mitochondrial outer membrane, putative [Candida dubliniensis CD36]|uniref:Sorting and assembly machinery (SAM) complex subunit of the mitochondrial outer membrane, putative n=1 Tax=Candida dubliniensis (strain CD36 / ATCC MYA-646 / CBS 7987 / NCPF 3949 / NRRL Y-17841) TaxID=573826 RepID=B9WEF8_CANDC|nr:sorting and assembly machinery (SAM) complex subunit of the mitochondrial outer membrane, putative [Candida dubliniensis CD36]CAX43070.1 sorting and assembly machinery (SAM) complex subunit of the mitochondrial outer membrane, putative [Candida dubliniensis CD36]